MCQKNRGVQSEQALNAAFMMAVEKFNIDPDLFADPKVVDASIAYLGKFVKPDCTRSSEATNSVVTKFMQEILNE